MKILSNNKYKELKADFDLYKDNHSYTNYEVEKIEGSLKTYEILLKANDIGKLTHERDLYKEVIEEVREYIDNNTEFEHDGDDYGYTEWVNIKPQNIVFINELLQILDKATKENK